MADEDLLRQAWGLYKRGQFASALGQLEAQVFQFREDPEFFRILGLCCLQSGDWKGGETYLQRSKQLDDLVHRDTLRGLLVLAARQKNYAEALKLALQMLDRNPDDRLAKRAMNQMKELLAGPEGTSLDRKVLLGWLPKYRRVSQRWRSWLVRSVLGVGLVLAIAVGTVLGLSWVQAGASPEQNGVARPGPEDWTLGPGTTQVTNRSAEVVLSSAEVDEAWTLARKAFQSYHDSQARFQINRIVLSNAANSVKERARALLPYLHEPDFSRPEDTVNYRDVVENPHLYEGCTVQWKGVLTNLDAGTEKIRFDLLLGYENGQIVQGVIPIELGFAALLKNSEVVEVLGRVTLRESSWYIQGVSLRELGYHTP